MSLTIPRPVSEVLYNYILCWKNKPVDRVLTLVQYWSPRYRSTFGSVHNDKAFFEVRCVNANTRTQVLKETLKPAF